MKKLFYGLALLAATTLCSCHDDYSQLGHSLVESSFYNVFVDTCYVDISTILLDSIVTRGDTICQLGSYQDANFGHVTSTFCAEYNTLSFTPNTNYGYSLDSLVLRLWPSGHYWGDTLTQQRVDIYELKYPIVLENDEDLYNVTRLEIEDTPLYSFSYYPTPNKKKEIEVRLPDEYGAQILDDLVAQDNSFTTQERFKKRFPGLAFVTVEGDCITGFQVNDSSLCVTLHYHELTENSNERSLVFKVNTNYCYNAVTHDPTGTYLEGIVSGVENLVHSTETGNLAFMQGMTGYYNQLEFPFLNDLESYGDVVSIEKATLYLYPVRKSYNEVTQLPDDIRLYITDENNVLEDYVYGSDGVTVQTGNLTIDYLDGKETYYSFDLTEFIRNNFGTWGMKRQKLLMNMDDEDVATTFNSVVFANDPAQDRQCRLDVRFKIYNEK